MSTNSEDELMLTLVAKYKIRDQADFLEHLKAAGVDMPQSTLSRRLRRLNIVKVQDYYKVLQGELVARIPILHVKTAPPNLMILHTLPGHASSLTFQLDQKIYPTEGAPDPQFAGLLGTIAGDDTVLVIVRDETVLERVASLMQPLV
jgi:transcriptional regulator of arginine metabolism